MRLTILTLGCRTNQAESLSIEKDALNKGYQLVSLEDDPDFCVINTCSVTSKADYQSRQLIRRALKSNAKIFLTGCYSELNDSPIVTNQRIKIIPNHNKRMIIDFLPIISTSKAISLSRARPIIKVQQGCSSNCSYCTIPKARGNGYSLPIISIIKEIKEYEAMGFNEIVLTGTNIGQYQYKEGSNNSIVWLLNEVLTRTTISRIRISSIEINYINKDFIDIIGEKRICKHLHIPLQSGSNGVLRLMQRPYLREEFYQKVAYLKHLYPDISIGSDIIVGFPNEGIKEFDETYSFLQEIPLSYFHVFVFSRRNGTPAAKLVSVSNEREHKIRSNELIALSKLKYESFIKSQIGKVTDFIIEKRYSHKLQGTTNNFIKASIDPITNGKEKSLIYITLTKFNGIEVYGKPKT